MAQRWYRYTFPAIVWTTARNREEAMRKLGVLVQVAANTEVGISVDRKPVDREHDLDYED